MQLEDFFDYKNQFMQDILTDKEIVQILNDTVTIEDAHKLVYTQVFPYEYIPEAVETSKVFVCIDVDVQRSMNKAFLIPVVYVWVFAHRTKLRLAEGGVLIDKLASEISKKLNGSKMYGLGTLELHTVKRFTPVTDYLGKVMVFNTKEWNSPAPNKHPVPSNRKARQ